MEEKDHEREESEKRNILKLDKWEYLIKPGPQRDGKEWIQHIN